MSKWQKCVVMSLIAASVPQSSCAQESRLEKLLDAISAPSTFPQQRNQNTAQGAQSQTQGSPWYQQGTPANSSIFGNTNSNPLFNYFRAATGQAAPSTAPNTSNSSVFTQKIQNVGAIFFHGKIQTDNSRFEIIKNRIQTRSFRLQVENRFGQNRFASPQRFAQRHPTFNRPSVIFDPCNSGSQSAGRRRAAL